MVRFANIDLPINPAWTLFHEVLFYAIFGFLILEKRIGIVIFIAWQATCLALLHYQGPTDRTFFTTLFSAYNLDFSVGIAAFLAFRNLAIVGWKFAGTMGAVIFIITLALESNGIASAINPLIYAISFGFAVLAAAKYETNVVSLNLGLLPLLGNASYSIYLTHNAIVGLLQKISIKLLSLFGIVHFNAMALHLSYVIILVSTITSGTLAYLLVEQPLLKMIRK